MATYGKNATPGYEAPMLRELGSVHELTQGPKQLGLGDALLWHTRPTSGDGGGVHNGS